MLHLNFLLNAYELHLKHREGIDKNIGKGSMALNLIMLGSNSHTSCRIGEIHREGIDGVESDNVI